VDKVQGLFSPDRQMADKHYISQHLLISLTLKDNCVISDIVSCSSCDEDFEDKLQDTMKIIVLLDIWLRLLWHIFTDVLGEQDTNFFRV
jgi:predicted membrane protein